jgi:hypothetical protein
MFLQEHIQNLAETGTFDIVEPAVSTMSGSRKNRTNLIPYTKTAKKNLNEKSEERLVDNFRIARSFLYRAQVLEFNGFMSLVRRNFQRSCRQS